MADVRVTVKVPGQLVADLQEQGIADIAAFLESLLRQVEVEDLIEMNQELYWVMEADTDDETYDEDAEFEDAGFEFEESDDSLEDDDWDGDDF